MAQLTRRDVLRAGLARPGFAGALYRDAPGDDRSLKPKRFEETAGFELAEVVESHFLAILPLGSLEFHGPHNPLGSDSIIISGIAERVAARTNGLLFPTITFTQCPAHTVQQQRTWTRCECPGRGRDKGCSLIVCELVGIPLERNDED